jgi:hypothetical protein
MILGLRASIQLPLAQGKIVKKEVLKAVKVAESRCGVFQIPKLLFPRYASLVFMF